MLHGEALGLLVGAVALGAVHGVEPGHGWPVAASYALDQTNKWAYGFATGLIIGVGHLVSSIAMVGAFFYAKSYFDLTQVNEPVELAGVEIGGPVSLVAGVLLVALGVREYRHGHSHAHEHGHDEGAHEHDHDEVAHGHGGESREHSHEHGEESHEPESRGLVGRLRERISFINAGGHSHGGFEGDDVDRGLFGIAWFAFVLGFAHEEEFEIIALCAGSAYCLELMLAYALTVIVGIVGLTMLLIAGYQRSEERVRRYAPYLPVFSAVVLVVMGVGFVTGVL